MKSELTLGSGAFRVVRHGVFRAQNAARAGEIGIRQHGAGGRRGYSGQLSYPSHHVEDQATRIGRRFLNQTEIELTNDIAARDEARIKPGRLERTTEE